ncbi:hypothetical protein [Pseudooceanicola nanhaiensis]|nr:hypothetical protein [Pseudooceanicola nanhaiensis]MCA0921697.1 hypothetical protein [Pseudooceanicola nanhaiensis]
MAYVADLTYKASSEKRSDASTGRLMRLAVVAGCAVFWGGMATVVFG